MGDKFLSVPQKERAALAAHVSASRCAARAARSNLPASSPPKRERRAGTHKDFAAQGLGLGCAVRDDDVRTEGVFAQTRVAPCNECSPTRVDKGSGCPTRKGPRQLVEGAPVSFYFFFGLGGGGTKPSTDIAMASLLRFAGTPRTKEASSTPVEGSLVAPKITAFAPTLAARSCIDL